MWKLLFYITLPFYKIWGIINSDHKYKIFKAELAVLKGNFPYASNKNKRDELITTRSGAVKFTIRDTDVDFLTVSSAFEHLDIERLKKLISRKLIIGKKVLFIDVGANFGKYSVIMSKYFKKYGNRFQTYAFEPEPGTFGLLKKNVANNRLKNIKTFKIALSGRNSMAKFYLDKDTKYYTKYKNPGSPLLETRTKKLDNYLSPKFDDFEIFIKLDVEGSEINVLKGAKKLMKYSYVTILTEDCMPNKSEKLIKYLSKVSTFSKKLTPYNSFWEIHN